MLALGVVLGFIGFGFFCWLLFTLTIYALPFVIGMTVGLFALHAGSAPLAAFGVGLAAAVFVLLIGRAIFSNIRTPILRVPIALMFALPAALAGYHTIIGFSGLTTTSDFWRQVFAIISAAVIGITAWTRLAVPPPDMPGLSRMPMPPS